MRESQLKIHSENILPIIKKWLYSDREIFLRELISNASDAIEKVKILKERGQLNPTPSEHKISISIDNEKKTLTISDTGIGMSEIEVEKYIAQIAFSGAEEFFDRYKDIDKGAIIGHFGLGFFSAYMVAAKVELQTLSHEEGAKAVRWICDGSSTYSIGAGERDRAGTDVILHLDSESEEFLEERKVKELLNRYVKFFAVPIDLNGKPLENGDPLWMKPASSCTDQEYIEFYHKLFPTDPDPIFWVHLNVDYPFKLQGILYFPKNGGPQFDPKESSVHLYCNRVFVSDQCQEILPGYLLMLKGAIDSPDIPLNVSRSSLQVDKNVKQLSAHISKKISDRLSTLYKMEKGRYQEIWHEIEPVVKFGILSDEKFYERAKDFLIWKKEDGSWTTLSELVETTNDKKVFYSTEYHRGAPIFEAYRAKGAQIIMANAPIDIPLINYLEDKGAAKFQRIDGSLDDRLLDPSRERTTLDADGKTFASRLARFIGSAINLSEIEVEAKSLSNDSLPALLILDEEKRRIRDYFAMQKMDMGNLLTKKTLVVNTNNKLIQTIEKLQESHQDVAEEMSKSVYGLALLSQREVDPKKFEEIISQQTQVLEKISSLLV